MVYSVAGEILSNDNVSWSGVWFSYGIKEVADLFYSCGLLNAFTQHQYTNEAQQKSNVGTLGDF